MNPINQSIPRLEQAFKIIEEKNIVLLARPFALVYGSDVTKPYHLNYVDETCECPDHQFRQIKCKHIWAAQLLLKKRGLEI